MQTEAGCDCRAGRLHDFELRFDEVFNFLVYRLYLPDVGLLRERVENIHCVEEFSGILGPR